VAGKENRRHSRVKPRGVVAHVRSQDRSFACQVENLSAGGLFLRTDQHFPRGSKVEVDLVKPGARRSLRVVGRVVGTITPEEAVAQRFIPGLGIEFDEMPPDEAERLQGLLGALGVRSDDAKVGKGAQGPQPARTTPPPPPMIQRIYTPPPDMPKVAPSRPPPPPKAGRIEAEAILQHIAEALDVDEIVEEHREAPGAPSTLPRIAAAAIPTPTPIPAIARPPPQPVPMVTGMGTSESSQGSPESARKLMLQIRGLLFELGEAQARLRSRETEIHDLRTQIEDMRRQIEELQREARRRA
jgi:Tfp pilus assembly protein PilZ